MPKRLIVCCDGTWQREDTSSSPSNPTLIARAIKQYGHDGQAQIVYYQKGVGSSLDTVQHLPGLSLLKPKGKDVSPLEGAFGIGLEDNVRAGYGFLAHNYDRHAHDEIYLFGWSRGAYTARSIAGLVSKFGLLDKAGMDNISKVYHAYISGWYAQDANPKNRALGEKLKADLKPVTPPIQCVGVWDTVGSLGIPNLEVFGTKIPFVSELNKKYQFHDTSLHTNIKFAFHALALNEQRTPFEPTIWHLPAGSETVLKQVWFPGTHGSVGGAGTDHDLSNIALVWMIQQVRGHNLGLAFDEKYLNTSKLIATNTTKPWGCADYPDTDTGIYKLAGSEPRTPGKYGVDTCESVHKCVDARLDHSKTKHKSWTAPAGITWIARDALGTLEENLKKKYPSK